ncbi:hypothetical protein SLE2022_101340 [Rubroshorea leprosula]
MEILSMAGDALLSAAFEWLLQKLDDHLKSNDLQEEVHAELQKWKFSFPRIRAVLNDAEEKQITNSSVKKWLHDLRDLAYDMEDVLDGFQADVQRSTVMAKPHQGCTSKFTLKCFPCFKHNDFVFDSDTISKVKLIAERLQDMIAQSGPLCPVSSTIQAGEKLDRAATRLVPTTPELESHVYGRRGDKEAILQKLLNGEGVSEGYCVLPIVGMGGIGKTTLARQVYRAVEEGNFQLKAWVCVSDQFEVMSITKNILIELTKGGCDLQNLNLNLLQEKLKAQLSNKKFLLVLDDVWNEECNLWDILKVPFKSGASGSIIIVTTRNEHVAEIMGGKDSIYHLKVLEDDKCLSILAQDALGVENFDALPGLKDVGQEMVEMCKGLPLAAKILGGLLRGKRDPHEWKYILKSKMWNLRGDKSSILPALMLSYHHLPSHLKQCFSYCAMFPKDHQFNKEELIFLWMAEGLLQKHPGEENQIEDIGRQYFSELLSRSFFQHSSNNESMYVMHDLIHDLAQHIAGETCCNLENILEAKKEVNFEKVRHFSFHLKQFDISQRFEVLNKMKGLRAFIPINSLFLRHFLSKTVIHDWLVKLTCLRALSLQSYKIRKLPDSIGDLKCLRYLNLSETAIETLPESIDSLTALEVIEIKGCRELTYLWEEGADTSKLARLERMFIMDCPLLVSMSREEQGLMPPNVRHLSLYDCGALKCLPDRMMMRVDGSNNMVRLEELRIVDCPCLQRFPRGKLPATCRLLKIKDCAKVESLPEGILGQEDDGDNSNNIENLEVSGLPSLNLIPSDDRLPTALKTLEINNCPRLESISERMLQRCLRLEHMHILCCVNLKSLSFSGLSNLTFLSIVGCDALESFQEMPELSLCIKNFQIVSCQNLKSLPKKLYNLTSLQVLYIGGCPGVKSIPEGGLPPSLTDLSIACENLKQPMREWGLHTLTSLVYFSIAHICPPKNVLPSSLTILCINDVQNLKSIPRGLLQNLKSLTRLWIWRCPKLRSLPREGLPPLLEELWINACPLLKREHFQEKGQYWPLTYHIPCLYIEDI